MTASVIKLLPADDPDGVLEAAIGEMENVLVLGWDKNGELYASATPYFEDGGNLLWVMEMFKHQLLSGDFML